MTSDTPAFFHSINPNFNPKLFDDHIFILPAISVGQVPQFCVDILLVNYSFNKIGFIYDDSITPLICNDPLALNPEDIKGHISHSVEIFHDPHNKLVIMQQRSPNHQKKRKFIEKLLNWIKTFNFSLIILLSSQHACHRKGKELEGSQFRYLSNVHLPNHYQSIINQLKWDPLLLTSHTSTNKDPINLSISHNYNNDQEIKDKDNKKLNSAEVIGGGITSHLYKQSIQIQIPLLIYLCFSFSGADYHQAIEMSQHIHSFMLSSHLSPDIKPKEWKIPLSFGKLTSYTPPPSHIYA